jgi:hypothetical protein
MRRRINMTKEPLPKWFVKIRRMYYGKPSLKGYKHNCINEEYD